MTTQNKAPKNINTSNEVQGSQELASKSPINKNAPLNIIREKELELNNYLANTKNEADKIIENAKKESEKIVVSMDTDGEKKAQEYFSKEFEKVNEEAKGLRNSAPTKAKDAQEMGQKNLNNAINQVKVILAPLN